MQSCLGIYVEENIIKYAKVLKDKDDIKIEAFNIEFYENLGEALAKIVEETYSHNIPISLNISNELYNYFEVFSNISSKDIRNFLKLEFEEICVNKGYDNNSLKSKYILMKSKENPEKYKALHISANKNDIAKKKKELEKYKVSSMTPISTSITNLIDIDRKNNAVIVNIENETKITTIVEGQIYRVDVLQEGMGKILEQINRTENSIKKAYEVCKNVTIYTQDTQSLISDETEYLDDIMPTLYKIVTETKTILDNSLETIDKVYITGLATAINNIDLYFQEYITNAKCEILKPFFIETSSIKVPIKDYIEVNSAIALALDGVGYLNKELNFSDMSFGRVDFKALSKFKINFNFKLNLKGKLTALEKMFIRLTAGGIITIIGFIVFSNFVTEKIEDKRSEVALQVKKVQEQMKLMDSDLSKINSEAQSYASKISSYEALSQQTETVVNERVIAKDSIPNFLNKLMFVIPQKVKVTSISNSQGSNHIVIEAESEQYQQLGYFTAVLKTQNVLNNIKSTSGSKSSSSIRITIEGDLP